MSELIVDVRNASKSYGKGESYVKALDQVNLTLEAGEFASVMGQSGCGKSTLLYLLGGLETPDSGTIEILGKDLASMKDKELSRLRSQDLGFVFQFFNLVQNLTVEENILLPLAMAGRKPSFYQRELDDLLEMLSLGEKRHTLPSKLSGGQQQRVAIARAVITKPRLLLADEPTGNLDSKTGKEVMSLFKTLHEERNLTILMVTHAEEIAAYSNRRLTMSDGRIFKDEKIL